MDFRDIAQHCDQSLAALRDLQQKARGMPPWVPGMQPDAFWFQRQMLKIAEMALAAGGTAHYERINVLCANPWSSQDKRYLVPEMIAAVTNCRLWAVEAASNEGKKRARKRAAKKKAAASPARPQGGKTLRRRQIPVEPGKRLRGGREILEAMEGVYTPLRWRAFKREARHHNAPIEWPKNKGQPRAWENQLRLWLAERMEAAEKSRAEHDNQWRLELDKKTGKQAYTGGDDSPLRVVRRPSGKG